MEFFYCLSKHGDTLLAKGWQRLLRGKSLPAIINFVNSILSATNICVTTVKLTRLMENKTSL